MIISVNSEVGQNNPSSNNGNLTKNIGQNNELPKKLYRPSVNVPENEIFSFTTEGAHYSPMALSSFSKVKFAH